MRDPLTLTITAPAAGKLYRANPRFWLAGHFTPKDYYRHGDVARAHGWQVRRFHAREYWAARTGRT